MLYDAEVSNRWRRPGTLQQLTHELRTSVATDLSPGSGRSTRSSRADQLALFERGPLEMNTVPTGEQLIEAVEVADGLTIAPGAYRWMRYRLEVGTAQKRRFHTQASWWFGGVYDGTLAQFEVEATGIQRRS